ncbi:MAG: hypothetical protein C0608_11410 [Deltaproteobacteria bacterium]|nr:MAG: hypothetical protein C0608_11410 [Deltaproteobacteria bacterium]
MFREWKPFDQGGREDLENWLKKNSNVGLVIIDTFQKVRPAEQHGKSSYPQDYQAITIFKDIADEYRVPILLIHHLRKMPAADPFEKISGSTGLTGAADTNMVLTRDRANADAVLHVTGRDVEEMELALNFSKETCRWRVLGDAALYRTSDERKEIMGLLVEHPKGLSPKEIAEMLGRSPDSTRHLLLNMKDASQLITMGGGPRTKYLLPG